MIRGIWRPRTDVPEFTRCCICLPLRYGLLAWGYSKMIWQSIILIAFFRIIAMGNGDFEPPTPLIIFLIIIIVDLIACLVFIVGGHLKHRLLYKVYYYYSIGFLIIFVLIFISNTIDDIIEIQNHEGKSGFYDVISIMLSSMFMCTSVLVMQVYVTLLTKSELVKLKTANTQLQFVNQTTDDTVSANGFTA